MDASEIQPLTHFLGQLPPFDTLSSEALSHSVRSLQIGYYSQAMGQVVLSEANPQLYIVRSGAFEVRDANGELLDRLGEGDYFGYPSLLSGEAISNKVLILEDGLLYQLGLDAFNQLRQESREFDRFFNRAFAKRLRHQTRLKTVELSTTRVSALMSSSPLMIARDESINAAAKQMRSARVSSLLVTDKGKLCGIITDKDLRNRVLAEGLDGTVPVHVGMTPEPITIESRTLVFDAMLTMSEHNIHHLPVVDAEQVVGVLSSTDILRNQGSEPLLLIGEIERQTEVAGVIGVSKKIPALLQSLISADARASEIGRILTAVTDALTRRLIHLYQAQLGEAPMAFCWLAFGSQARQDQAACSDQDNGLLLEAEPDPAAAAWFQALSEGVCSALDACGYVYCPGGIMAQNSRWRMSRIAWQRCFEGWINTPEPKALMHSSIFFDMRPICGPAALFDALQEKVLEAARKRDIFLAGMAANCLEIEPPLGFFRQFVLERDGSEVKGMDLKHKGIALINDIARIYALSAGIKEVNTAKRIRMLMEQGVIERKAGLDLADAQEFIAHLRLANQGRQFEQNAAITNFLKPKDISSLVRHQLVDAFKVVHDAQSSLRFRFLRRF